MIQKVINALGSPEVAIDDKHGPKLYSRLLQGLLATVRLDPSRPGRRTPSHTRQPSSKSSLTSGATSPSRSSVSPIRTNVTRLNLSQIQVDDGQNSPGDWVSGGSPSSMQGLNVQEFFAPPLPFDGELLHSMQNLTNSTEWGGMALPGAHCSFKVHVPNMLIMVLGFHRMELDGRFTAVWRSAPGFITACKFPSTPYAGRIYGWGFFHRRVSKVLRSGGVLRCDLTPQFVESVVERCYGGSRRGFARLLEKTRARYRTRVRLYKGCSLSRFN